MNGITKFMFAAVSGCLVAAAAQAQQPGVPEEIIGYRNMSVNLSEDADDCNLTDPDMFREKLTDGLAEIGINQTNEAYSNVELRITAARFGGVLPHCVTSVELFFRFPIGSANFVTSDERLKATIVRMKVIPVIIYEDGQIGVQPQEEPASGGESTVSQEAVLDAIGLLVDRLAERRA